MTPKRPFTLSAQQVDPLSWFTGPLVPLAVAAIAAVYGGVIVGVTWSQTRMPWLQLIALLICVASALVVHLTTRPMRQPIGGGIGAIALGLSALGLTISAAGYSGTPLFIELWWAPGAVGLTIVALGPYLPGRTLLPVGIGAVAVSVIVSVALVLPSETAWGPVATAVIVATPPLLCLASMMTFSYAVVSAVLPMLESPSRILVAGRAMRDEAAERIEKVTLAQLTARAAPFLEKLAETGRVFPEDRALAGQIARRLRDELVTQSNVSWLDSIAAQSRLVVVDPHRLATRMSNPQRTALRGLLGAVLDAPGTDSESLMVELRKAPDGATAVAVSLDMTLPEGRRIMHLAPYYLTLKTAVEDLSVRRDGISFRIAAADRGHVHFGDRS